MVDDGIATRRGVMCSHREPAYKPDDWSCIGKKKDGLGANENYNYLIHSEEAQDHTIILPLYPQMSEEEQDKVIQSLTKTLS